MKRGTIGHPKTLDLQAKLGVGLAQTLGHLEALSHFTAQYARVGDIGRWPNGAIAKGCLWDGEPDVFVRALTDSRWLDECDTHRLVVHDWPDHADDAVHMAVARDREWFANGATPRLGKISGSERAEIQEHYAAERPQHGHGMATTGPQSGPRVTTSPPRPAPPRPVPSGSAEENPPTPQGGVSPGSVNGHLVAKSPTEPAAATLGLGWSERESGPATTPNAVAPPSRPPRLKPKADAPDEIPPSLDTPEFRAAWGDWTAYRRERRNPMSARTVRAQLNKLNQWGPDRAVLAIRQTIEHGWTGLFEPKENGRGSGNGRAAPRRATEAERGEYPYRGPEATILRFRGSGPGGGGDTPPVQSAAAAT